MSWATDRVLQELTPSGEIDAKLCRDCWCGDTSRQHWDLRCTRRTLLGKAGGRVRAWSLGTKEVFQRPRGRVAWVGRTIWKRAGSRRRIMTVWEEFKPRNSWNGDVQGISVLILVWGPGLGCDCRAEKQDRADRPGSIWWQIRSEKVNSGGWKKPFFNPKTND